VGLKLGFLLQEKKAANEKTIWIQEKPLVELVTPHNAEIHNVCFLRNTVGVTEQRKGTFLEKKWV
jgi:hypothetical protein